MIESEMTKMSLFIAKFRSPPKTGDRSFVQLVTECHALIFNCRVRSAAFLGCRQPGKQLITGRTDKKVLMTDRRRVKHRETIGGSPQAAIVDLIPAGSSLSDLI
jgi:hypothetical protein